MANVSCSGEFASFALLANLPPRDLAHVTRAFQVLKYGNGEIVFGEGRPCTGLYLVKTGMVKLLRSSKDKQHLFAIAKEGEILDLVPLLDNGPHTCTAQARGPITVYFVDFQLACELIWSTPPLLAAVLFAAGARLRILCSQVTDLAFQSVTSRVSHYILETAKREGERRSNGVHLKRTLSQAELAGLVGTSREVVWRALKKLEEKGLIRVEQHEITIIEPERLALV